MHAIIFKIFGFVIVRTVVRKNYFNFLDMAIAVVMLLSEDHLAETELTFLK